MKEKATIYDLARFRKDYCDDGNCCKCPLCNYSNSKGIGCTDFVNHYTDEVNELILKWCKEHPAKTYKDDFLKKFPNCDFDEGRNICRKVIYDYGERFSCAGRECKDCWNEPIVKTYQNYCSECGQALDWSDDG